MASVLAEILFGILAIGAIAALAVGTEEFRMTRSWWTLGACVLVAVVMLCVMVAIAQARDLDGRYANSPLKLWFDHLSSGKGLCCSMADGEVVADPDWESKGGHYRVRLDEKWVDVPDDAVITEPNKAGRTMVWPMHFDGEISVRCFMPGSMT